MDSKLKAHSSRGTPLTVKWTVESIEGGNLEPKQDVNRWGTLVSAFVIGLGVIGFVSWFFGGTLWIVHSVLGGYLTCVWLQRLGEKRFGWQKAHSDEGAELTCSADAIRKRRLAYSTLGFVIGLAAVALPAWLMGKFDWILAPVIGSCAGREIALGLGERFRGLPSESDLALARLREEMSPVDLKPDDRVPVTLKTAKEVRAKK